MPDDHGAAADLLRVLVVDDERLARERVVRLLEREADVDEPVTAATGAEAVERIERARTAARPFDIVFLDVQMPGLSGLDVVREVGPEAMPVTVFVTAYDQHAVDAFDLAALDYLLKPYENERFRRTLQRARETVRLRKVDALQNRLLGLLQGSAPPAEAPAAASASGTDRYAERITVEMRGQVRLVPVEQIDYFEAEGNYVRVHAGDEAYVIDDTLRNLEERLDPDAFLRIHRSTIVQLDRVEALLTAPGGDYAVRLHDGTRLKVARGRRDELNDRLGIGH